MSFPALRVPEAGVIMPLQYLREWQSSLHLRRGNSLLSWLQQSEATKVQLLEAIREDFGFLVQGGEWGRANGKRRLSALLRR